MGIKRSPIKYWSVLLESGEIRECRSLRTLVWSIHGPAWVIRLRFGIENWVYFLPCRLGRHEIWKSQDGNYCLRCDQEL